MPHTMTIPEMQSCLDACLRCFQSCEYCAAQCLGMPDMAGCAKTCLDCTETCRACVALMARESILHGKMCALCAEACRACAEECGKHEAPHCQDCAAACRLCAEECERMAQMVLAS